MERRWWKVMVGGLLAAPFVGLGALAYYGSGQIIQRRKADEPQSPADYDLDYEAVEFPSRDGLTTLRGWFIPTANAKGSVVFCHGHMGSMDPDLAYVPWFNEAGYNLLMFDFRGHGRSDGANVSMGYYERWDLLGAVDYLRDRDIERIGVLGFSMGGAVAISTAPLAQEIAAIVADGTFAEIATAVERGARRRYGYSLIGEIVSDVVVRAAGWRLGCDLSGADPIRWVGRLGDRPLLLIHGEQDPFVSTADVRRLYGAASEPKELWLVPEAGHREIHKARPGEYRDRVIGFFDEWL